MTRIFNARWYQRFNSYPPPSNVPTSKLSRRVFTLPQQRTEKARRSTCEPLFIKRRARDSNPQPENRQHSSSVPASHSLTLRTLNQYYSNFEGHQGRLIAETELHWLIRSDCCRLHDRLLIDPIPHYSAFRVQYDYISTQSELHELCDAVRESPGIFYETEFISEETYRPEL